MSDPEETTRRIAGESQRHPTAWFEQLYEAAADGEAVVPWDREVPQVLLTEWAAGRSFAGGRALVVGAGLGMDAEFVASLGFATTAFDIAPTAIAQARARFPESPVDYRVADLLDPPADWRAAFDFVFESLTVQALPQPQRAQAIAQVGTLVAPGGTLLVVSAGREPDEHVDGPPWPLTRAEVDAFAVGELQPVRIEQPASGLWRAEFRRPPG